MDDWGDYFDFGDLGDDFGAWEEFGFGDDFEAAPPVDWNELGGAWEGALAESAQQNADLGSIVGQIATALKGVVSDPIGFATKLLSGDKDALKQAAQLGLPAALLAGLFEKNQSPLLGPMVQGAQGALEQAGKFAALPGIALTPSQRRAIALSNETIGAHQPYLDRAGALADRAAGGINEADIPRYQNPYLRVALDSSIRDIEEDAERQRQMLRFRTAKSGNDFRTPGVNRFNVEDGLLDQKTLKAIGDISSKMHASSFENATGYAGKDLDRSLYSSNIYGNLGKSAGALGAADVENLKTAGALERLPMDDQRQKTADTAKLYTGVVHGTAPALEGSKTPSTLTNLTGTIGALGKAKEVGLF